ncbi:MAG TPA: hypothetical protein QF564_05940 [Pirellulaceae bacterium]|nr:hypothetical protein [Pirellulaceae bacterium]
MMTTQPTTPKRWRPRFSVRTLVVLVTLVCCYAACWGPTKRGADNMVKNRGRRVLQAMAVAPLIIKTDGWIERQEDTLLIYQSQRHYYFWFFGYNVKLPYERDL